MNISNIISAPTVGDNIVLYIILFVITLLSIIGVTIYNIKNNKK